MTTGGFDCNSAQTEQVATAMTNATAPLDAVADRAPEVPNAGTATGAVVEMLSSLAGAMQEFTTATAGTGTQVADSVATYRRDDEGAAGAVNGVPIPAPPR